MKYLLLLLILVSCNSPQPKLTPEQHTRAQQVPIYLLEQPHPPYQEILGEVVGVSQDPTSATEALARMRLQALDMGAEAVIQVTLLWVRRLVRGLQA